MTENIEKVDGCGARQQEASDEQIGQDEKICSESSEPLAENKELESPLEDKDNRRMKNK